MSWILSKVKRIYKKYRYIYRLRGIIRGELGKEPVFYDIGANVGRWSEDMTLMFPRAKFFLFEPLELNDKINNAKFNWHHILLSHHNGEEIFNYSLDKDGSTGSSIYEENTLFGKGMEKRAQKCYRLDDYACENGLLRPDIIKIDTQGSELDILTAAPLQLTQTKFVICELPIVKYNHGAPNIAKYFEFFDNHDFAPLEIIEHHYDCEQLLQIDVVFVKR